MTDSGGDPKRAFLQVAAECQAWRYRVVEAGTMANDSMSLEKVTLKGEFLPFVVGRPSSSVISQSMEVRSSS